MHAIATQEALGLADVLARIESIDLTTALLDQVRQLTALLALVPVPADDGGKPCIYGKASAPAIEVSAALDDSG